MYNISFRKLKKEDKDSYLQLLSDRQDESNANYGGIINTVLSEGKLTFDQILNQNWITVIVAEQNKKIIATVTLYFLPRIRLSGRFVIFEDVLVAKSRRGMGVGTKLIEYAINYCKQFHDVKKIKLGTRKDNEKAQRFYFRLGFKYKEKLLQLPLK